MAHASANTDHPAKQGMFGIFEVFADTVVICTVTALAILMSGCADQFYGKAAGTDLTILSFGTTFGTKTASIIIATCITMFAFSTILSWSLYGSRCFEYLGGLKAVAVYKVLYVGVVVLGAAISLQAAWTVADILNALMALPNLIAVLVLSLRLHARGVDSQIFPFEQTGLFQKPQDKHKDFVMHSLDRKSVV